MLFEGNVAGELGSHVVADEELGIVPPGHRDTGGSNFHTGCVRLAVATDANGNEWELLPPLITAVGVNDQRATPFCF